MIASGPPGANASLAARGITKRFGDLLAVDHVDFDVRPGEVHALIGENGAGKSTLMNVLYGLLRPDGGTIVLHGREARFASCADAMRAGIGMVFQHFLLIDHFTVAENVLLGREPARTGFLRTERALADVAALAYAYGFPLEPGARVESLNVGARQQVELLKVLERNARIVILDEPTAALSPAEAKSLFTVIRRLRDDGRAVILIAHKLKEVLALADRITVLRRGKIVGSLPIEQANANTLAAMMVGRSIDLDSREPRRTCPGEVALSVRALRVVRADGTPAVADADADVRTGEILGIAGVEGNGQLEFAEALYGLRPIAAGRITYQGADITGLSIAARRGAGMRYVPADRQREGLVLGFDTVENALLGDQRRTRRGIAVDVRLGRERADAIHARYAMAGYDPSRPAGAYSGGTQQKLIVGREMTDEARVLICNAPTRGVDVGSAVIIHRQIREARDRGACVLIISYDLDEIRALSDRVVVFSDGRISAPLTPDEADDVTIGRLMTGAAAHG